MLSDFKNSVQISAPKSELNFSIIKRKTDLTRKIELVSKQVLSGALILNYLIGFMIWLHPGFQNQNFIVPDNSYSYYKIITSIFIHITEGNRVWRRIQMYWKHRITLLLSPPGNRRSGDLKWKILFNSKIPASIRNSLITDFEFYLRFLIWLPEYAPFKIEFHKNDNFYHLFFQIFKAIFMNIV